MRFPRKPKAVIFDMDGTLIDTVPLYARAMVQAGVDVEEHVSEEYVLSLVGLLGEELEARLLADRGSSFPVGEYLSAVSRRLGPLLGGNVPLKRHARELIQWLMSAHVPLAIATSMKRAEAEHHLRAAGLRECFRHIVARDDVAQGKPHPEVYQKAAARLSLAAEDCVALEDSFNGVRAASAAGTMTIMVPDVVAPTLEIASLCVCVAEGLDAVRTLLVAMTVPAQEERIPPKCHQSRQ